MLWILTSNDIGRLTMRCITCLSTGVPQCRLPSNFTSRRSSIRGSASGRGRFLSPGSLQQYRKVTVVSWGFVKSQLDSAAKCVVTTNGNTEKNELKTWLPHSVIIPKITIPKQKCYQLLCVAVRTRSLTLREEVSEKKDTHENIWTQDGRRQRAI